MASPKDEEELKAILDEVRQLRLEIDILKRTRQSAAP